MKTKPNTTKPSDALRYLALSGALVIALSVAFTGAASAQTEISFQASVNANTPPSKPCPTTTFCGSASIAGYGPATWTLNAISTTPTSGPCPYGPPAFVSDFTYTAITTFELVSGGGTLVLDESGLVCAPGNSASAPPQSHGFPEYASSSWTVDSLSNGQFSGLAGSGTDALHAAGAHFSGTYSGTLLGP
jgi:hypothetical protein